MPRNATVAVKLFHQNALGRDEPKSSDVRRQHPRAADGGCSMKPTSVTDVGR